LFPSARFLSLQAEGGFESWLEFPCCLAIQTHVAAIRLSSFLASKLTQSAKSAKLEQ
jgi:hypothetical protein